MRRVLLRCEDERITAHCWGRPSDLVLAVDGDRACLPSGVPIQDGKDVIGQRVRPSSLTT